jgi:hypothetical protein
MRAIHLFEIKWLYEKYSYMISTGQHIPNTKKWEFIDYICRAYSYSEDLERDISEQDLNYIHNCIIPGFIKGMTDGEIRTFEFEMHEFLSKNTDESVSKAFEEGRKKLAQDKEELEQIKSAAELYEKILNCTN